MAAIVDSVTIIAKGFHLGEWKYSLFIVITQRKTTTRWRVKKNYQAFADLVKTLEQELMWTAMRLNTRQQYFNIAANIWCPSPSDQCSLMFYFEYPVPIVSNLNLTLNISAI